MVGIGGKIKKNSIQSTCKSEQGDCGEFPRRERRPLISRSLIGISSSLYGSRSAPTSGQIPDQIRNLTPARPFCRMDLTLLSLWCASTSVLSPPLCFLPLYWGLVSTLTGRVAVLEWYASSMELQTPKELQTPAKPNRGRWPIDLANYNSVMCILLLIIRWLYHQRLV